MAGSFLAVLLFAITAFAQNADIGLPTPNQTVLQGSSLVVQVQRPNTLTGSEEVAVVIGLLSCLGTVCNPPSVEMGIIMYNGPFQPQPHEEHIPPYQNFTVEVPKPFPRGTAQIGVAHVTLINAGPWPFLQTISQAITID